MAESIEIIVDPSGGVVAKAVGYQGSSCVLATMFIAKALGQVLSDRATPDMYLKESNGQQINRTS